MRRALRWIFVAIGVVGFGLTVLPIADTNSAYVRVWDFPRLQILVLLLIAVVATPFVLDRGKKRTPAIALILLAAALYQGWRIRPYTPLHALQAAPADGCTDGASLKLLAANVFIHNRQSKPLLDLIHERRPDVVLLLETDRWWAEQVAGLARTYPHHLLEPLDNSYGMLLYSRWPIEDAEVRRLVQPNIPSMRVRLKAPNGDGVVLFGVHPRPPPRRRTANRDAELLLVAKEVRAMHGTPIVTLGDLNDVAWSDTSRLFRLISGLLDPRIGRGQYATFNADWPLLKWPLDHVFYSDQFLLNSIEVLPDIGSDHYPFMADLCLRPRAAARQDEPEAGPDDREDAREAIEQGLEPDGR